MGFGFEGLGFRIPLKYIDNFGYIIIRSPYTPYSIYLRGTIGFRVNGPKPSCLKSREFGGSWV